MEFVADLWLPILLSAVFVFIVSSILHMVLPFHKGDYKKLPGEEKVLAEMRAQGVQRGHYTFPCPGSMKEMCSPEMIEKYNQGPVGHMIILPSGPPRMGKCLTLWFLYSVLISFLVAYVASPPRASYKCSGGTRPLSQSAVPRMKPCQNQQQASQNHGALAPT